jgi:hypothetical protein
MTKTILVATAIVLAAPLGACGRQPLTVPASTDAGPDASGVTSSGGAGGRGGGAGGAGGNLVILRLPDGGLAALLGDSGVLGGILDAPRDSLIGQVFCGPEARLGATCSNDAPGCILPSLGGGCLCVNGYYLCPLNPNQGPTACPAGAATGTLCLSPLSVCIGGGANACICGLGSFTCF